MNLTTSYLCSVFSICSTIIYLLLRTGFQVNHFAVIKTLGFSFLLIILPILIKEYSPARHSTKWFSSYSFLLFSLILLTCLLGYAARLLCYPLFYPLSLLGYVIFLWFIIRFYKEFLSIKNLGLTILTIFFSIFINSVLLSYHVRPLFIEDVYSASYLWKVDTLYHIANAEIFNNYGVLGTGLDGLKYIPYHYGFHILYTGYANLLNISISEAFLLFPSLLTASLFFFSFFHLTLELKRYLVQPENNGYLYALVILVVFVGYFRNTFFQSSGTLPEYIGMLLGSPILFISDSYTVSLIFLFLMFSTSLAYFRDIKDNEGNTKNRLLYLWVILPVFFFCAGFTKISTLFIIYSVILYLLIRLKLYYKKDYLISYLLISVCLVFCYYLTRDHKYDDGGFSLLYHFKEAKQNVIIFIIIHFSWCWVLGLLFFSYKQGSTSLTAINHKNIPIEIIFVMVMSSLIPAIFIKVRGGQLYYFTEISVWVSCALLISCLPLFMQKKITLLDESPLLKKGLILFTLLYFSNVFYKNFGVYKNQMLRLNYSTRYNMLNGPQGLVTPEKFSPGLLFSFDSEKLNAIQYPLNSKYFNSASINPSKDFINKLLELNKISLDEKRKSVVYVNFNALEFNLPVKCYERPLLIPALSGMVSINGGITGSCLKENPWFSGYGYEYYNIVEPSNLSTLRSSSIKMGFQWIYYYDTKARDFIKIRS